MRDAVARLLLGAAALALAGGGAIHAGALSGASQIINASAMPAFYVGAYKALWLADSVNMAALAAAFAMSAVRPIGRAIIAILALASIGVAATIYVFMGGFFAGHLMLFAGAAALAAATLRTPVVRA